MSAARPDSEAGRWIATFLDATAAEHGTSRNTQLAYGRDLVDFADWLARRGKDLAGADRQAVEDYLVHCDAQGLSRATRARRLSSIRQLYRFAFEEGWRGIARSLTHRAAGDIKKVMGGVSAEEAIAAFARLWVSDEHWAAADKVIARLLAGPAVAYAKTKHAINGATLPDFDAALARETAGQHILLNSADLREGIRAFQEKRDPTFTDT